MDSLTPHDHFQQALPFDEPASSQLMKTCTGPCGRTLPATAELFYRNRGKKDGLDTRCKECDQAKKNKNTQPWRKRPKVEVPPDKKICIGLCEQTLPATTEYFQRDNSKPGGFRAKCKVCQGSHYGYGKASRRALNEVPEGKKVCIKCDKTFDATPKFFQRDKQKEDGLYPWCKECTAKRRNTPEGRADKLAYNRAYYGNQENRDRILAQRKDKYHTDPGKARQQAREYNKLPNRQAYNRAYLRDYNQRPDAPARHKVYKSRRRTRKQSVSGKHTAQQIQDLLKRQKHKCYYCSVNFENVKGRYVYHVDHTFPLSRVADADIPANDISYLVLACPSCNMKKHDKFPWEWAEGGRLF